MQNKWLQKSKNALGSWKSTVNEKIVKIVWKQYMENLWMKSERKDEYLFCDTKQGPV